MRVSITGRPANPLQGIVTLAHLSFRAVPHENSTIVPLQVRDLQGTRTSGSLLQDTEGIGGRVFVIAREPILDAALGSNQVRIITVYGHPNRSYILETNSTLASTGWISSRRIDLEESFEQLEYLSPGNQPLFYRLRELASLGIPLSIVYSASSVSLSWPSSCDGCILEEADTLNHSVWSRSAVQPTLAGDRYTAVLPATAPAKFYRLQGP